MTVTLDRTASYAVKGFDGIAFRVYGFRQVWEPYMTYALDEDGVEREIDSGEGEWVDQDESCGRVLVVMVGDDRKLEVEIEDLTVLAESAYCLECGQIGCGWHTGGES